MNAGLSRLLIALTLFCPLAGCSGEGVTTYTAPSDADPGTGPVRLLGAIIPAGEDTWFIKLTGRNEEIEPFAKSFDDLLASLQFPEPRKAGEPSMKWDVPKGWKEEKAGDRSRKMDRVATLTPEGKDKPEITITKLPQAASVVKPNVDRWRRNDLGLIPIAPRAMEKVVREREVHGHKITVVDMRGPGGQGGMAPPMAGHPLMPKGRRPQGKSPVKYKVPEGWKELPNASMIAVATLQVSDGAESARLLVSPLSKAMPGGLPANVNRWRGDVGLPPLSAAEVGKLSFPTMQVAGIEARTIDLEGKDKRSLVVWFDRGETMWFFKFIGPTKLVGSQKAKFEEFMKSVQFPGGAE